MNITTPTPETVTITTTDRGMIVAQSGEGEVHIAANRDEVLGTRRVGDDAIIRMTSGEEIVLEDYFRTEPPVEIYFADDAGWLWMFENVEGTDFFLFRTDAIGVVGAAGGMSGGMIAAMAGGGAAVLAGLAGGGGGGGDDATPPAAPRPVAPASPQNVEINDAGNRITGTGPDGTIAVIKDADGKVIAEAPIKDGGFDISLTPPLTDGEELDVVLVENGLESAPESLTAPTVIAPPAEVVVSDEGKSVIGKITGGNDPAGMQVEIRDADGKLVGSGNVASNGDFNITLTPPRTDGEELTVVLIKNGESSDPVVIEAPLLVDGPQDVIFATDGSAVTGTGKEGDTAILRDPVTNEELASAIVEADGTFTITLDPALDDGQKLEVVLKHDETVSKSVPTTAPDVPSALESIALDADTGIALAGVASNTAEVVITDAVTGEVLAIITVDQTTGAFSHNFDPALRDGQELKIALIKRDGADPVVEKLTAPVLVSEPTSVIFADDGSKVTGTGEKGTTAILRDPVSKEELGTAIVDDAGNFTITLQPPVDNGEALEVVLEKGATQSQGVEAIAPTVTMLLQSAEIDQDTGASVSGKAENATKAVIYDANGVVIVTLDVDPDTGEFFYALTPALRDGQSLKLGLIKHDGTDPVMQPDLTAPDLIDQPDALAFSNAGGTLSGESTKATKAKVSKADGSFSQEVDVIDGRFTFTFDPPLNDGEALNVVLSKGEASSTPLGITAPNYIEAPTDVALSTDGLVVSGAGKDGKIAVVRDADGTEIGRATVVDGRFSVKLDQAMVSNEVLSVMLVKDGLTSTAVSVSAGFAATVADNVEGLALDILPTGTSMLTEGAPTSKHTGFALAKVAVGEVLSADVINAGNPLKITVGENESRQLTLKGDAGGVALLTTFNLVIYQKQENGTYARFDAKSAFLKVALLGGISQPVTITLPPGEYAIGMEIVAGVNVAVGYSLYTMADVVYDYTDPTAISGSVTGNVLTDMGDEGQDVLPAGSVVSQITVNGVVHTVAGETEIAGTYGVLTIRTDGSYSYAVKPDLADAPIGERDVFTYQVTKDGSVLGQADLTINLDRGIAEEIVANANVTLMVEPTITVNTEFADLKDTDFKLLSVVGLSNILDVSALDAQGGISALNFSVGAGQRRDITFDADGGGISIGSTYHLKVYKRATVLREITNEAGEKVWQEVDSWVEYHTVNNFLTIPLLGARADEMALSFGEGDYAVMLESAGELVSLLTGVSVMVNRDVTYDFGDNPAAVSGVTTGDIAEGSVVIGRVEDIAVAADGETEIHGTYGVLSIKADGSYSYRVYTQADGELFKSVPYGAVEDFRYTAMIDGKPKAAMLTIAIGDVAQAQQAHDMQVEMQNVVIKDEATLESGSSWRDADDVRLSFADNSLTNLTISGVADLVGELGTQILTLTVTLYTVDAEGNLKQFREPISSTEASIATLEAFTFKDLPGGNYVVKAEVNRGGIVARADWQVDITYETIHLDQFEKVAGTADTRTGTLIGFGDVLTEPMQITVEGIAVVARKGDDGEAYTVITGDHGALTVMTDGSYSYQASGATSGTDKFSYTLTPANGPATTHELSFDVARDFTAPADAPSLDGAQLVLATDAVETFTTGDGADVVRITAFNSDEGTDIWTDFDLAEGDRLDLQALLPDLTAETAASSLSFKPVESNGEKSTQLVYQNAGVTEDLIILQGVELARDDLTELLLLPSAGV